MYCNFATFILSALAVSGANAYTWTRCTNAEHCLAGEMPGPPMGVKTPYGGFYMPVYDSCTDFEYDTKDGYWYSHEKDGLFVSNTGYLRTAHDCNLVLLRSKNAAVGTTAWWKHRGGDCCLPDEVGWDIDNVGAFYTGDQ
ncbi:hypothetical protein ColTof4_08449 [Colletotrichum tofieldiae]|nr:hypothetical protein ColTof3_02029 [Colletotrichum tofieldiae]GKT76026.1 hypothetical protein ColTof4_08449 [Colletotrichum tofieldiae]GKT83746.1 hypothetical protein Ct61P_01596 [Colletotrichum tofieldiae]